MWHYLLCIYMDGVYPVSIYTKFWTVSLLSDKKHTLYFLSFLQIAEYVSCCCDIDSDYQKRNLFL